MVVKDKVEVVITSLLTYDLTTHLSTIFPGLSIFVINI